VRLLHVGKGSGEIHIPGQEGDEDRTEEAVAPVADNDAVLAKFLGKGYAARYDSFDLAQFAYVVAVCRDSDSAADAAKKLFAVSRQSKKSSNDSDRLSKYLSRFGLKFKNLRGSHDA
jgi:transcriptional regulatory protein RtcR